MVVPVKTVSALPRQFTISARPRTTELKAVPSRLTEENGPLVVVECRLEDFGEGDPEWVRPTE